MLVLVLVLLLVLLLAFGNGETCLANARVRTEVRSLNRTPTKVRSFLRCHNELGYEDSITSTSTNEHEHEQAARLKVGLLV